MLQQFIGSNNTHEDDANTRTHLSQPATASRLLLYQSLVELTDSGPLLFQCLVDPVGIIRTNAPHPIPWGWGLSGRKKFSPKDDIPDLDEKFMLSS